MVTFVQWLNKFPLFSPEDATDAFSYDIISTAPDDDKVRKFADYFCETYIDTNMYLPELCSQTPTTVTQTNKCRRNF